MSSPAPLPPNGYIHFFDIDSRLPGKSRSWSPNTLKIREVLNYKRIPYIESFLSYPDIRPFAKHFNIPDDPGAERPTLPAILVYDAPGSLRVAMSDSRTIAAYLDQICPERSVTKQIDDTAFRAALRAAWIAGYNIVLPTIPPILDERGSKWFIADRTEDDEHKRSPLEWGAENPEDDWAPFNAALQQVALLLDETSDSRPFLTGENPCYEDFTLAAVFTWFRRGSEANFQRILAVTNDGNQSFERHYKACTPWIEGSGEVTDWMNPSTE